MSNNGLSLNSRKGHIATTRKNAGLISQKSIKCKLVKRDMSSDHSIFWTIERIVSIGLLGVTPAFLISPNLFLDDIFAILKVLVFHWKPVLLIFKYLFYSGELLFKQLLSKCTSFLLLL